MGEKAWRLVRGTVGHQLVALLHQRGSQGSGVGLHLPGVRLELRAGDLHHAEQHRREDHAIVFIAWEESP